MSARIVPLHPAANCTGVAAQATLAATDRYLGRCKLAANTVAAYRRQGRAYVAWLGDQPDRDDAWKGKWTLSVARLYRLDDSARIEAEHVTYYMTPN